MIELILTTTAFLQRQYGLNKNDILTEQELQVYNQRPVSSLARVGLRVALGKRIGVPPAEVQLTTLNAKPCEAKQQIYFSQSHSRSLIAYALSKEYDLGVDIEYSDREIPSQQNSIRNRFTLNHRNPFLQEWTCLEAKAKLQGVSVFALAKLQSAKDVSMVSFCYELPATFTWHHVDFQSAKRATKDTARDSTSNGLWLALAYQAKKN
ncbi:MAG: hypothetical protein QM538_03805 [Methylacidiphilales bacterium]|nr:hypothetical protein [Candidatus Methylacidiphilales bacterium]